jgi:hypothetical protein
MDETALLSASRSRPGSPAESSRMFLPLPGPRVVTCNASWSQRLVQDSRPAGVSTLPAPGAVDHVCSSVPVAVK